MSNKLFFFLWSLFSLTVLSIAGAYLFLSMDTWYINLLCPFVAVGFGFTLHSVIKDFKE
ncbi:hypothetical protein [Escherichia phage vB_EcoM_JNE01]|nr:hypothetical protein [Escherichia phage vB_EcoM_JNE01]